MNFFRHGLWAAIPKKQIIATTYSHDRATDVGRVVRDYMLDPMYQEIFAGSNVSSDSKSAHKIGFDEGGNYYSVGVGGAIVGRGAHVFLIDDPIKSREEAESEVVQRKTSQLVSLGCLYPSYAWEISDCYNSYAMELLRSSRLVAARTKTRKIGLCLNYPL